MARLGKKPVIIPEKVKVALEGPEITVTGEKGTLKLRLPEELSGSVSDGQIILSNSVPDVQSKAYRKADTLLGLYRKLTLNMVKGVSTGFEKILEIHGVGFKAEARGENLVLHLGFTHPVVLEIPSGINVEVVRNTIIFVRGCDKQLVGSFAAKIRAVQPPEPYKGTGIRYRAEYVRQKVGKAAAGGTK